MNLFRITITLATILASSALLGCKPKDSEISSLPLPPTARLSYTSHITSSITSEQKSVIHNITQKRSFAKSSAIEITYPQQGSIFPPDFFPPTFLWRDPDSLTDRWIIEISVQDSVILHVLTSSPNLPAPEIDPLCISPYNVQPDPINDKNWMPESSIWKGILNASQHNPIVLRIFGFRSKNPVGYISTAKLNFSISRDSVIAPIFYRDVPIMPNEDSAKGVISPIPQQALDLVKWRLRDLSQPVSKVVLEEMPTCANCHSFSHDGKFLGMDIDGPQGDKGAYALSSLSRKVNIKRNNLINWNYDFKQKPKGTKTIGFLSRMSPDGNHVISTVNESVFVVNYRNYKYIQVFYPTRGVLAYYSKKSGNITLLPGAADPRYVHCNPVWSPDGKTIVFSRAPAKDPYVQGQKLPAYPNAPEETQIQYNLYRIPFNNGKGGKPLPVEGASYNQMSNTFPKVSKDGKFIVFVKCKNGQLLRPDSELWIVPFQGGTARRMRCNTQEMNSWHSFSPNSRWMVFASKANSFYTQMFLTHIDEEGMDSPAILIPQSTAANRAVNLPEFVNIPYESWESIDVPAVSHMQYLLAAKKYLYQENLPQAMTQLHKALEVELIDTKFRAEVLGIIGWLTPDIDLSISYLEKAVKEDPQYPLAQYNLAMKLESKGKIAEAFKAYEKSLEIDPKNIWAMASLSRMHLTSQTPGMQGKKQALSLAQKANELSFYQEPALLQMLARAHSEFSQFDEAEKFANLALQRAQERRLMSEVTSIKREREGFRKKMSFTMQQSSRNAW